MSNENGFKEYAQTMIMDGYLELGEERDAMMKATEFGLSGPQAQEILVRMCREHGAILERVSRDTLAVEVKSAVGDLFLDDDELAALRQRGALLFDGAGDPVDETNKVITKVLHSTGAYTQELLKASVRDRLQPYVARGSTIVSEEWDDIRQSEYRKVEDRGVDCEDNEIGSIIDQAFRDAGLSVVSKQSELLKNPAVLGGVGAVLIAIIWLMSGGDDESQGGQTPNAAAPAVAATPKLDCGSHRCPSDLMSMRKNMKRARRLNCLTTPERGCDGHTVQSLLDRIDSTCEPFEDASPSCQSQMAGSCDSWNICRADAVEQARNVMCDSYLDWAQRDYRSSRSKACQWLERCKRVSPGHGLMKSRAERYGCSF
jgi:hypothetical protein